MSMNTIAIFGPLNQDLAAYTGSACSSLHIPHIETRIDANTVPLSPFSINIHPDADLLAKACLDVIKHFGWTEMLIIYGDQIGEIYTFSHSQHISVSSTPYNYR